MSADAWVPKGRLVVGLDRAFPLEYVCTGEATDEDTGEKVCEKGDPLHIARIDDQGYGKLKFDGGVDLSAPAAQLAWPKLARDTSAGGSPSARAARRLRTHVVKTRNSDDVRCRVQELSGPRAARRDSFLQTEFL